MRVLITGCTGQDGSYLAERLAAAGHTVTGMVRGQTLERREWLQQLVPRIRLLEGDLLDQMSLHRVLAECAPEVIFNLAAVSAPGVGWREPVLMAEVTGLGVLRLLESARVVVPAARVVQAGSLATHGPYGAAKSFARAVCADYRQRGIHVSCAVMGGHHSPRRGREFFTRKVTRAAARIHLGLQGQVRLGPLARRQDWGWASDFTAVLARLPDLAPGDYVISTGRPRTSQEWVAAAFAAAGLDWHDHVKHDSALSQPTDVAVLSAPPDPRLGWEPLDDLDGLARVMVTADLEREA